MTQLSLMIKSIRQRSLLSQEMFSQELNVSIATINRWENGKAKPNIMAINKIRLFCEKHNLSFVDLENEWLKKLDGENK